MNRQQRRLAARQRKIESRVEKAIIDSKCDPKEIEVEIYYTAFGLALEEIYGFKAERIKKVWKRADEYIGLISDGEKTFKDLKQILKSKANIECSFN